MRKQRQNETLLIALLNCIVAKPTKLTDQNLPTMQRPPINIVVGNSRLLTNSLISGTN